MGLFDIFKKDKKDKKVAEEKKEKKSIEIPKDSEIPEVELQLKEIAMKNKNRNERML